MNNTQELLEVKDACEKMKNVSKLLEFIDVRDSDKMWRKVAMQYSSDFVTKYYEELSNAFSLGLKENKGEK